MRALGARRNSSAPDHPPIRRLCALRRLRRRLQDFHRRPQPPAQHPATCRPAKARATPTPSTTPVAQTPRRLRAGRQRINIFNTTASFPPPDRAKMLGQMNERSPHLLRPAACASSGINNQAQLHPPSTPPSARVSFWAVDARRPGRQAPLGDASQGSPATRASTPEPPPSRHRQLRACRTPWYALAAEPEASPLRQQHLTPASVRPSAPSPTTTSRLHTTTPPERPLPPRQITLKNGEQATLNTARLLRQQGIQPLYFRR